MSAGYEAGYLALGAYGAPNSAPYLVNGATDIAGLTSEILTKPSDDLFVL